MKFSTASAFSALAVAAYASPIELDEKPAKFDFNRGQTREMAGHKIVPGGIAPQMQDLAPRYTDYYAGAKRTKVRYGPYNLPKTSGFSFTSVLTGEKGTMSTVSLGMKKPCETCNLLAAQAGLEYAEGNEANVTNGAWLHHIVVVATGTGRADTSCPGTIPGERFFSSGNERTPTTFGDVTEKKIKSTFPLHPSDGFQAEIELMNMKDEAKAVYLTIDYEYIPGEKPADWKTTKAMWLDVTGCGISYVMPPTKKDFQLPSRTWAAPYNGEMLGVGGHLHDGGTHLDVKVNGKVICDSKADYGVAPAGEPAGMKSKRAEPAHAHGATSDGKPHIREMSTCTMMGSVNKGDKINIEANYEFSKFPGLKATEIMGIAIMYLAFDI